MLQTKNVPTAGREEKYNLLGYTFKITEHLCHSEPSEESLLFLSNSISEMSDCRPSASVPRSARNDKRFVGVQWKLLRTQSLDCVELLLREQAAREAAGGLGQESVPILIGGRV